MSKKNFISEAALKDKPQNKYHLVIKDGAVSTDKLADSAVKTEKIADENVTTEKIKDRAITNDKVADKTLTADKFSEELNHDTIEAIKELQETKFDKANVVQELGDSEEKVVSQAALPFRYIQSEEFIFAQVDAEDHLLFGIQLDGTPVFGKKSSVEEGLQSQVTLLAERVATIIGDEDTTNVIDSMNELKQFFANIENTQKLTDILLKLDTVYNNLNTTMDKVEKTVIKDEEGNVLQTPFKVIDSPEFLYVVVDAEDHFLFGIQLDGSVEWSVGIPAPIREKLNEIVNQTATDKTDLSTKIDELNASMQIALDTKVDKEEGKSLIDDEVKQHFEVIENDEWLTAMVDAENHLLFGIRRDTGKPYFPLNDMYHVEQNDEFFALWIDEEDHILMGIRRDGEIVGEIHAVNALKQTIADIQSDVETLKSKFSEAETKVSTIDANLQELLNVFSLQENPEFLAVETDAEGKMLAYTKNDGSHYVYNMKSETIPEEFSHIEDPEGRMAIETDAEQKILAYRDKEGVKHEHEAEVNTLHVSNLDLKDNSVNDIQSALIANGFNVKTPIDWSESSFIQIPEPRFAIINITNIDSMPTTKTDNKKAFLELWDMQGNYFKKHVLINAQGNSSMWFVKKNAALDICDDEWIGDETPKIRFGNWVPQDSFHLKAFYTDFFRGISPVCYKLYDEIVRTRGNMYDRPWKKALLDMSKFSRLTKSIGNYHAGQLDMLTDTGARCFPDGFPVACYLNGLFYGVFSWQLKKHRDNYHMDKSTAEHVHLDGEISIDTIFNKGKDNINWNAFEIRNPKSLYAIGGNKYDADIKQEEIAGETEIETWLNAGLLPDGTSISAKIKKNLQLTAKVKKYIQNFADVMLLVNEAASTYEASSKTEDDLKAFKEVYEKYFDVDNIIDYLIFSDVVKNIDGFIKNWQWFTYDGVKWYVGVYDCDMTFGGHFDGNQLTDVLTGHEPHSYYRSLPTGHIILYYTKELEERYAYLAKNGIISSEHILSLVKDWMMRIGTSYYKEEYEKWSDSPCNSDSIIRTDYWEIMCDSEGNPLTDTSETFNATNSYTIDDEVSFGISKEMGFYKFKCIRNTYAIESNVPHKVSAYSPIKEFRHSDNIYRIQKWIEENIKNMNNLYNYKK